jgi:hypothetical protein
MKQIVRTLGSLSAGAIAIEAMMDLDIGSALL